MCQKQMSKESRQMCRLALRSSMRLCEIFMINARNRFIPEGFAWHGNQQIAFFIYLCVRSAERSDRHTNKVYLKNPLIQLFLYSVLHFSY